MPREEDAAPNADERETARSLGRRVARVAARLRDLSEQETPELVAQAA